LKPPQTAISPRLALVGFERLNLNAGETKHVTFRLDPRALSGVDDKGVRAVSAGRYQVSVGGSEPDGDAAQGVQSKEFSVVGTVQIPR
jgi:beta-glucosidase